MENEPWRLIAPNVGLSAKTPQKLAGRMVEPRAWVPSAAGSIPAATAAALPLDDPPGVRRVSNGLRVRAGSPPPKQTVTVFPTNTPPPRPSARTVAASVIG